jgi:hypothetical protein
MTGAGGSGRLAYGNFYLQKTMAECFRPFYTTHLFCHPRDDLIESDGGSTRPILHAMFPESIHSFALTARCFSCKDNSRAPTRQGRKLVLGA